MGTHPIFESDFDCLTDLKSTCNHACQVAKEACPKTEAKAKKDASSIQVNRLLSDGRCFLQNLNSKWKEENSFATFHRAASFWNKKARRWKKKKKKKKKS